MAIGKVVLRVELSVEDTRMAAYAAKALVEANKGVKTQVCLGEKEGPPWIRVQLEDWRVTPLTWAIERLGVAAGRFGVQVSSCQVLGKIPVGALVEVAGHYLKLKEIAPEQLIFDGQ